MNETQNAVSKAANPRAALLQIAVSLDRLHNKFDELYELESDDPWGEWEPKTTLNVTTDESGEIAIEEPLPPIPKDDWNERRIFAKDVLGLDEAAADDYSALGPVWFYGHHRDIVIQHGRNVHVQMIQDAETYDPQAAAEMGRDLLKSTATGMAGGVLMAEGRVG